MEASLLPVSSGHPPSIVPARGPAAGRVRGAGPTGRVDPGRDELFVMLLGRFRPYGGLARASELWQRRPGSASVVASAPLQFDFGGTTWLPGFQFVFGPSSLDLDPAVVRIAAEFGDVFDGWRLTLWFGEPNTWLDDRAPVEALDEIDAVCAAARADRYVATG